MVRPKVCGLLDPWVRTTNLLLLLMFFMFWWCFWLFWVEFVVNHGVWPTNLTYVLVSWCLVHLVLDLVVFGWFCEHKLVFGLKFLNFWVCLDVAEHHKCGVWFDMLMARPRGQKPSLVLILMCCDNYFVSKNVFVIKFG